MATARAPCGHCGCPQARQAAARRQQHLPRGAALVCRVVDAAGLQELIVGSAVTAATAAALVNGGSKGEPEVCVSCAGTGGVKCFACEGSGKMEGVAPEALAASARQRGGMGGSRSRRECVACKGAGKIFCRPCSGSGYSRSL